MRRRWIIRGPFLMALTIAAGLWVASYVGCVYASVSLGACWAIEVAEGLVAFEKDVDFPISQTTFGFAPGNGGGWGPTTFGFYLDFEASAAAPTFFVLTIPMWLVCLFLGLLNWFVWRKTLSDGKGSAFPVVP